MGFKEFAARLKRVENLCFAPLGLAHFARLPTACAVGCIRVPSMFDSLEVQVLYPTWWR